MENQNGMMAKDSSRREFIKLKKESIKLEN